VITRRQYVVALMLIIAGTTLLAHGGYWLYWRDEAVRDRIYVDLLEAISTDHMADVLGLARDFAATNPANDPRLAQVRQFAHEAAAREAVRLARQGDVDAAERLLADPALDDDQLSAVRPDA
jgi:hypothetical protein